MITNCLMIFVEGKLWYTINEILQNHVLIFDNVYIKGTI